jgi:dual specificity tyrosine-phosphorylation-regulated kinase 1
LGCTLVECHTGEALFPATSSQDLMVRLIDTLGMPPLEILKKSSEKGRNPFFVKVSKDEDKNSLVPPVGYVYDWTRVVIDEEDQVTYALVREDKKYYKSAESLRDIIGVSTGGPSGRRVGEPGHSVNEYEIFLDFISQCLSWDQTERYSADDLLSHPFISGSFLSEITL